jgi:hypothetical protein
MVRELEIFTGIRPVIVFGLGFVAGFLIGLGFGVVLATGGA